MSDRWIGITLLGLALGMAFLAWKLPLGSFHRPGPGLFPLLLALVLALLSLVMLLGSWWRHPGEDGKEPAEKTNLKKVSYVIAILLVYASFFQNLGFLLSTFIFFLLLKPIVEKKWGYVVVGSLVITLASYVIFDILLQSQLPRGVLAALWK